MMKKKKTKKKNDANSSFSLYMFIKLNNIYEYTIDDFVYQLNELKYEYIFIYFVGFQVIKVKTNFISVINGHIEQKKYEERIECSLSI